jgi:phage terminase large subunit
MTFKATIVFEKIWNAIHEKDGNERKYKYIILTGSSRSSKTYSILQALHLYALQNNSKRISSWRETKKDCKDTVLHDYRKAIYSFPNWENITFNKTESIHTFPSSSTYEICGGDDDVKIHGFAGDVAHFNEPYQISKATFDQIDMRTSEFILIDWNPRQNHWIDELSENPRSIVIHSTFRDNPFVPIEQRNKILSYQNVKSSHVVMSGILELKTAYSYDIQNNPLNIETKYLNELVRCISNEKHKTANDYDWQVYGLGLKSEKPNRFFHWKECTVEEFENISTTPYIGIDWGKVDPFGIVKIKYHDGRLFLHELNYDSENKIRERLTADELRQVMASNDQENGIVSYVFSKLNIDKNILMICDTNRPEKGALLRQRGYNVIPAVKPSIMESIELLQSLDVYYTNTSTNIKIEQENYEYKIDKFGDREEQAIDEFNHIIDPTRYVVHRLRIKGIIKVL